MELVVDEYKQTEFGPIPADWINCRFEDVMDGFSSGQTPFREIKRYYNGNIPWITSGELNYNIINDTLEKITLEAVHKTTLKIIPKGTFLMAITGLEAEGTRGSCAITGLDATTNQSCMALYPKKEVLTTEYLYHFYVHYGEFLAFRYCQGTKQQSYTGGIAKTLPIVLPPTKSEQIAIAICLSDADSLISSLEKLIAKKRNIKQGVMQKLLQPKDGWQVRSVKELASIGTGSRNTQDKIADGKYPFFVRSDNVERINSFSFDGEAILVAGDGVGTGKVIHYVNGRFDFHQRVYKISEFTQDINGYYFYLYFKNNFLNRIMQMTAKSSVDSIRLDMIANMQIPFPSMEEQIKIALTLRDIESEIRILEKKLEKQNQLKQGMMQNLLTGKIRLI
jgi:type I restriction enzyme S subunit